MGAETSQRAKWRVAPRIGEDEQRMLDAESLLEAQLLWNRGIRTAEEAYEFLMPATLATLGDPLTMWGVPDAVSRIRRAISEHEPVAIYGDYDVDGVAGAALLATALKSLGADVFVHLPDRARDGYGVNADAVRQLAGAGARVMITVDCGISANAEVDTASELGMDVIVTDHHTIPAVLPTAYAVLNPHHARCGYPFKDLAGGGVALQLARALFTAIRGPIDESMGEELEALATFAALSTVADVVPLTGENRIIVRIGLAAARAGRHAGLAQLCRVAGRSIARLTAQDLAFTIIPRLNAAGRMGDARRALDLLLAEDQDAARRLARTLDQANLARRDRVGEIMAAVEAEAAAGRENGVIVLAGAYPVGLAGLIATRVAERYAVPCVVIEQGDEMSRGSVRGVEGIHLVEILQECASYLIQFGGHARAAGFSINSSQIEEFRRTFEAAVGRARSDPRPQPAVDVDGVLSLSSIGTRLADLLDRFEPAGAKNPRPLFLSQGVLVRSVNELTGGHLSMRLAQGMATRRAIAFRPAFVRPLPSMAVDVLYEVERSTWAGEERVEMIVRDLRPSAKARAIAPV